MPELPEVETVRRGLAPRLAGAIIRRLEVREWRLRWPIAATLPRQIEGLRIQQVSRRAKYLLFDCGEGHLILHLGMSGSLVLLESPQPLKKHDHYDLILDSGAIVRFNDPRRFGSLHWMCGDVDNHVLLRNLGPEPLAEQFSGKVLHQALRGRSAPIKSLLMDQRIVVGIGNIYANEALFLAGIHPRTAAGRLSLARCDRLVGAVQQVLRLALQAGGSTLRDFVNSAGEPGYFQMDYRVYGREDQACRHCSGKIRVLRLGQRGTFYCPRCQR